MLGDFTYSNPTRLYFGKDALNGLDKELPKYGKNVLLVYGGGSIKKNGIYDKVVKLLKKNGKEIFGTLRMDHSDIEEPPYLFLELKGHTVDDISRQKFVTFAVEQKDFLPRN